VKEEGWPIHPHGVVGHPLGHWGGSATTKPAGLVVAEPPQLPKGVAGPPPVKEKKSDKRRVADPPTGDGSATTGPAGLEVASHPHGLRGGQPPCVLKKKKKTVGRHVETEGIEGERVTNYSWSLVFI
jgi:hypothetical protein